MPQHRNTGAAWDRTLVDYGYTDELDRSGLAWEYLRRNLHYQIDYRVNRAGHPAAIRHVSGAILYRPRRRFLAAESWGLAMFAEPSKTAPEVDLFWLPQLRTHIATCTARPPNEQRTEPVSLESFKARRAILSGLQAEQIHIQSSGRSVDLLIEQGSLLVGGACLTFFHEGLTSLSRHHYSLQLLKKMRGEKVNSNVEAASHLRKYRDYLVALDGHLERRSYRDIAEALFGKDRVGACWTDDTHWMKSKVRRAVERGIALMNGGYRDLL